MSAITLARRATSAIAGATLLVALQSAAALAVDHPGTNGKFTSSTSTDPFSGRTTIKITYYPDPAKVGVCSAIYIAQTVRRTDQNGAVIQPKDLDDGKFKHAQDDMTAGGTCVDHMSTEKDPYYNGEDKDKDDQSRGSTGTGEDATASEMEDTPHYNDSTFPPGVTEATLSFEDCAVCKDTGKILDCVSWSYHRTKGEAGEGTITPPTGAAPPSQEFKDAKAKFEDNHVNGTKCPEEVAEVHEGEKNITPGFHQIFPPFPHPMQPSQLRVDVVNSSGQPVNGVQWSARDQGGSHFLAAGTTSFIGPFDFQTVIFTVPPVPSPAVLDLVVFTVDPTGAIPEYDETDNVDTIPVGYSGLVGVEDGSLEPLPGRLTLSPNPFRSLSTVAFILPRAAAVSVEVYDLSGARVKMLHQGNLPAGAHQFDWDGRGDSGRRAAAGVYSVRVRFEGRELNGKVILLR